MALTIHTTIEPARLSLFLALGLLACGNDTATTDTDTGTGTTQPASTGSTGLPTTGSTGELVTTGEPTSGVTGTSATSTDPTTGTTGGLTTGSTGETSGVSATTGETTGDPGTSTSTGSTGDSSTGDASTGDTDTGVDPTCVQLMQGFTDPPIPSGWEKCGDLLPHRVSAEVCEVPATPSNCDLDAQPCQTNDDCDAQPFGSCQKFTIQLLACGCVYGCESDADCAPGTVCRCAGDVLGPATRCVPSTCEDDADCGDELCQFSQSVGYDCGPEVVNGACTTPNDVCESDPPCVDTPCAFVEGTWQCSNVACGRPFVVDCAAVTAPASERVDWTTLISAGEAPAALREPLARYWAQIARCEHASIASFARFILQLLAVGAPPQLVLAAQQALADEVEHARLAFALASRHAGRGVGPGPLPGTDVAGPTTLDGVLEAVIHEACVGETLSALEAREAAERAQDPALRRVLTKIADDEQRHAELGWRVVQWALATADAPTRARAQAAFTAAISAAHATADLLSQQPGAPELRPHGVVDDPLRAAVWREGLRSLVTPTAAALRAA
jgi:hypothetical protein